VRIKDSALIAAAMLSHRYITDRFLPDKAIDLIDEAASKLRIEIDSMPSELDDIERKISISLTEKAKDFIARTGYDPSYGARPLKRTIQHKILDPLSMKMLNKELGEGDSIEVDVENDKIVFRKAGSYSLPPNL